MLPRALDRGPFALRRHRRLRPLALPVALVELPGFLVSWKLIVNPLRNICGRSLSVRANRPDCLRISGGHRSFSIEARRSTLAMQACFEYCILNDRNN